jgi:uncharacterized protein
MSAPAATKKPTSWRRVAVRYGRDAIIIYVGALLVLMLLENWMVYKATGPEDWQVPPNREVQDVQLTAADGTLLHGWWLPREGSKGAVIYFHGNAGNLSGRGQMLVVLRQELSEPVLIVDYPGYGKSGGSPSEAGCYASADAAYNWLTDVQKIPGENIILYGASLGGGVAVDIASRKPYRALVLIKTFTTMPEVGQNMLPYFPVRWLMRNRFNSLEKLKLCQGPVFIAHGDADDLVPFAHGERLFQAAPGPKEFLRLPGSGHDDSLPAEFFGGLKQFLARTAPLTAPVAN